MAAADESRPAGLEPFDYQRDVEDGQQDATPDRITPQAKKYIQSSVTWMYVWATMIGAFLAVSLFTEFFQESRKHGLVAAIISSVFLTIFLGLPLGLLLRAANAFQKYCKYDNVRHLVTAFRFQYWLFLAPYFMILVMFVMGTFYFFLGPLVGVFIDV